MKDRVNKFFLRLVGMTSGEMVESRAVRDVAGSLFLHVTGRLLQLGVAILLARILSLEEFGLYMLVISWVMVLVVPSLVGTPQFVQREIAVAKAREQWGRLRALFRWSTLTVFTVSFLIFMFASAWVFVAMPFSNTDRYVFLVGFTLIPLMAFLQVWQSQLRAWGAILPGQIPEIIIRPLLFGLLLLLMDTFFISVNVTASIALVMQSAVTLVALGVTVFFKFHHVQIPKDVRTKGEPRKWLRLSSRFTLLSGLAIINYRVGILMVGAMSGKADTGLFSVAVKGADLLIVALMAANMALAPRMAAFYHEGNFRKLQRMITRTYRVVALISIPVLLLFVFLGNYFLRIFGPAYVAAWPALIILSCGQFFNVVSGPIGSMLNMAGRERLTMIGVGVSVVVTVAANVVLIPLMGIIGAALASVLGIVIWNALLVYLCYTRLGIWTPVWGLSLIKRVFSNSVS